jgi:hypothetical protein
MDSFASETCFFQLTPRTEYFSITNESDTISLSIVNRAELPTGTRSLNELFYSETFNKWNCVVCGIDEKYTPVKRLGPDGKRNFCNTCYVRMRVNFEKLERGKDRPNMEEYKKSRIPYIIPKLHTSSLVSKFNPTNKRRKDHFKDNL